MTSTSPDPKPPWATVLASIARRSRLRAALRAAAPIWVSGAMAVTTAALLGFLGLTGLGVAFFTIAGAGFLLFVGARVGLALLRHERDPHEGATIVDREQVLDDTLKSALEPPAHAFAPDTRESHFRAFLEQRADQAADALDPAGLVPLRVSLAFPIGALLLLTAIGLLIRTEEFVLDPAEFEAVPAYEPVVSEDSVSDEDLLLAEELALTPEELLQLTPEQLAQLKLRRGEAAELDDVDINTMSPEELSDLLQELGAGSTSDSGAAAEQVAQADQEPANGSEDPTEGAQSAGDGDGLEELRREGGDDPFAPPAGEQAQQGEESGGNSLSPGDQASGSDDVQKIELPPMANPNARQAEGGEPSSAVAMAGAEASQEMAMPPDAAQSGAGGGESSGPQGGSENPLGEITEIAVTLELALLEAEKEADRPVERSVRHRASEAQEAKVRRRGINAVDESRSDQTTAPRILSAAETERMRRYFDPKQWPKDPPSNL